MALGRGLGRASWLVALGCCAGPGLGARPAQGGAGPASAVHAFLTAFENLDEAAFATTLAEDVCVFFPTPTAPDRVCGKAAVLARFRVVFAEERRAAPAGPPFLSLVPEDEVTQALGPEAAVVTFHLRNEVRTARRSFVLRREADGAWRVAHLHASNVPASRAAGTGEQVPGSRAAEAASPRSPAGGTAAEPR